MRAAPLSLTIKAETWTRDSHSLFDYDSDKILRKTLATSRECYVVRNNVSGDVQLASERELLDMKLNDFSVLLKASPTSRADGFSIENKENDMLGMVLKKEGERGFYKLRRGDVMKLGRMRIKLKDYRIEDAAKSEDRVSKEAPEGPVEVKACNDKPIDENDVCRICFSFKTDKENPLISACKCTGTMKFIHLQCLKAWLNLKLVIKEVPNVRSYFWQSFECEICKAPYPYSIMQTDTRHYLIDIQKPSAGTFLMLESLDHEKNTSRIIHIVAPTESRRSFKLGRGHEADIRVGDISVSRVHAAIECSEHGVFVEDNKSKFGTLVLVPEIGVRAVMTRSVQVGRTLLSFEVKAQKNTQ